MGNGFHASSCMTLRDCMPPAILLHHCNTAARYSKGFQTACMARFNTQQPSSCFQTFGHSVSRGSAACCCSAPLLLGYLHKQEHQPLFTAAAAAAGTCALDASEPPSLHCCGRRPSFAAPLHLPAGTRALDASEPLPGVSSTWTPGTSAPEVRYVRRMQAACARSVHRVTNHLEYALRSMPHVGLLCDQPRYAVPHCTP